MHNTDYNDNNGYDFDSYTDDMLEDSMYEDGYDDDDYLNEVVDDNAVSDYDNDLNFSSPTFEQASFIGGKIVFESRDRLDDDLEPGFGETDYSNSDYANNELIVSGRDIDGDGTIDEYDLWDEHNKDDNDYDEY